MKKVKKDHINKNIKPHDVSDNQRGKVDDLAPKAKNLPSNMKSLSQGLKTNKRKLGEKTYLPINPRLKSSKK